MENSQIEQRVNHPSYYTYGKIETIDFINDKDLNFNRGQVIKYTVRAGLKHENGMTDAQKELEDLKKAKFYLSWEIKKVGDKVAKEAKKEQRGTSLL